MTAPTSNWKEWGKAAGVNLRPPTESLADLPGMTAEDWRAVYIAYQGFLVQVRLIAADVKRRG